MIRNPPLDTVRAACAHLLGPCCFLPSCPLLPSPAPSPSCCCWPPLAFSLVVPVTLRLSSPATQSLCGLFCFSCFLLLFVWCFLVSLLVFVGVFCCCACCQPTEVFTATQPCKIFFRPTPDGSRQVVYQAGKTIALCKFTELMQWQHCP